jgi:hypothetical protein
MHQVRCPPPPDQEELPWRGRIALPHAIEMVSHIPSILCFAKKVDRFARKIGHLLLKRAQGVGDTIIVGRYTQACQGASEWSPGLCASSHVVPCLSHRVSLCGMRVSRFAWVGNVTVFPCGWSVLVAPHSGHSTLATVVRTIWSGVSVRTPAKGHLVAATGGGVSPTASRVGARSPTRPLRVGVGDPIRAAGRGV